MPCFFHADRVIVKTLSEKIDALLPQTQCTKCGYDGCMPYAEAIATTDAAINRCPPGGEAGIAALAALLNRPIVPLDLSCGAPTPHRVAMIDEAACIGCAKCLNPCPTDAIIGANKFMHTVIASLCTGCELCIPPCPVDCITMVEDENYRALPNADFACERFRLHNVRIERDSRERSDLLAAKERAALYGR
jgi:Na+-translocating ferredoxin:NAD+ oxidoreductase subunit B